MAMTKMQIISALAEEMGISKKQAACGLAKLVSLAYTEAKKPLVIHNGCRRSHSRHSARARSRRRAACGNSPRMR